MRDHGPTEIGGFAITRLGDPLFVEDVVLVKQSCTAITVKFDDTAVANFFDDQIDLGRRPEQFGRIWVHSHPGSSAQPSLTDERTFDRVFGRCDWAAMVIIARGGESYARLRFNRPRADVLIGTRVEWSAPFAGSDHQGWLAEYQASVNEEVSLVRTNSADPIDLDGWNEREFAMALW